MARHAKLLEGPLTSASPPVGAGGVHLAVLGAGLQVLHMGDHAYYVALELHVALGVGQHVDPGRVVCTEQPLVSHHPISRDPLQSCHTSKSQNLCF